MCELTRAPTRVVVEVPVARGGQMGEPARELVARLTHPACPGRRPTEGVVGSEELASVEVLLAQRKRTAVAQSRPAALGGPYQAEEASAI